MNRRKLVLGFVLVALLTTLALATPYFHSVVAYYADSVFSASLQVPHRDPIDLDVTHIWKYLNKWSIDVQGIEDSGWNDWLTIKGSFQHLKAPHDEPPNENLLDFEYFVNADDYPSGEVVMPMILKDVPHAPTDHPDELLATLVVQTSHAGAGSDQIDSYVFRSWATHLKSRCKLRSGGVNRSQKLHDSLSTAFGCATLCLDEANSLMDLNIQIEGIVHSELLSAALRCGSFGSNGPVILDLGPPSHWQDMDGHAIGLDLLEIPVPPAFIGDILDGNAYVEIATLRFPGGEVRGQLTAEPMLVAPQSFLVRRGRLIGGGLPELQSGGDQYVVVQPKFSPSSPGTRLARIDLEALAPTHDVQWFKFDLQTSSNGVEGGTLQSIRLYNWAAGSFELVDVRTTTASDAVVRFETGSNPQRFIELPSGRMLARVSWEALNMNPAFGVRVSINQARFEITPRDH